MKKEFLIAGALVIIAGVFLVSKVNNKNKPPTNTLISQGQGSSETNIFKDMNDLCGRLSKEQVGEMLGKTIVKTTPLTSATLHSCQYYINDTQAVIINNDFLNVEKQKKGHEFLDRKIVTNPAIPMDHFLVIQEDGLINEIYLVLGQDNYVSINRTSAKTASEDEIVAFAAKLAGVIIGKTPLLKANTSSSAVSSNGSVPLPSDTDILNSFFNLIEARRASDAVGMMSDSITKDEGQKQAWGVQLNAIKSIKILNTEPSMQEAWTATRHTYKITMDIMMDSASAGAPIPYYGYENGKNIRWVTLEKEGKIWRVMGIATGP